MAVAISFANGFKFSYSGDCRPSRDLAAIGKHSTVLVHEATFDDELQDDAIAKKHSTISEAAGVGVEMGARRVILTHFSQRYSKIPTMSDLQGLTVKLESAEAEEDGDGTEPIQEPDLSNEAGTTSAAVPEPSQLDGPNIQQSPSEDVVKVDLGLAVSHQDNDMKIAVAFDYMHVKVKDIASLEKFTPALRELYKADEVRPVDDRTRNFHVDGGQSGTLHRVNSKNIKGGIGYKSSGNGSKRQAAANNDEGTQLKTLDSKIADLKLEIGARDLDSLVGCVGKPSKLIQQELLKIKEPRKGDGLGLVEDDSVASGVEASPREICAS